MDPRADKPPLDCKKSVDSGAERDVVMKTWPFYLEVIEAYLAFHFSLIALDTPP
jgi:hypothetical protein